MEQNAIKCLAHSSVPQQQQTREKFFRLLSGEKMKKSFFLPCVMISRWEIESLASEWWHNFFFFNFLRCFFFLSKFMNIKMKNFIFPPWAHLERMSQRFEHEILLHPIWWHDYFTQIMRNGENFFIFLFKKELFSIPINLGQLQRRKVSQL